MRIQAVHRMIRSDVSAWRSLNKYRFATYHETPCVRCAYSRVYQLAAQGAHAPRYRCPRCCYTFGVTTGTWLAQCRLRPTLWLWLIKLFELELVAQQAGVQTGLSYPTALRAFTTIRRAILSQEEPTLLAREVEADESYFGPRRSSRHRRQGVGRASPAKIPVFGILERHGRVQVSIVPDCSAESLLAATLRTVKRGSLVYTDRWRGYDTLTFCGYRHLRVNHDRQFSRPSVHGKVHINGLEGFWSYAKGKLLKHHGVSPWKFPLYLYEMQFRYNHRRANLFELLLDAMVQSVPDL